MKCIPLLDCGLRTCDLDGMCHWEQQHWWMEHPGHFAHLFEGIANGKEHFWNVLRHSVSGYVRTGETEELRCSHLTSPDI